MAADILIDELLLAGLDDWVAMHEVAWIAKSTGNAGTDDAIARVSLDLVRAVLSAGLMTAGDVTDGGFFAWETGPEASMARIERAWKELGHLPEPGDVCWLDNTKEGDDRARAVASGTE